MAENVSEIVDTLKDRGAKYLRFELPDTHGTSRSKTVPIDKVQGYAERGLNLYGGTLALDTAASVVPGTGLNEEINYADTKLWPDFSTLQPVPWIEGMWKVVCDLTFNDGTPVEAAPRFVLKKLLDKAEGMGFSVKMGHEFEFYLLDGETMEPFFEGLHIFNTTRNHWVEGIEPLLDALILQGVDVITHNCEYAASQYEVNFGPGVGLAGADKAFTFKATVKELCQRLGYHATFMSKPWPDRAGCGCHVHMGLNRLDGGANAFVDTAKPDGLSDTARQFVAGILTHAKAMMPLIGPTPNCYHRLQPHTFAPSNVSWGVEDRTAMVRVKASADEHAHIEMRAASGLSNPYLSAAATLAAGLLGIEKGTELAPEVAGPSEEDESLEKLPKRLDVALAALEADADMRALLGEPFVKVFGTVKRHELARFHAHVTDWERNEYMEVY
jgi:glutamine synthetase